jgi:hypothetical protein
LTALIEAVLTACPMLKRDRRENPRHDDVFDYVEYAGTSSVGMVDAAAPLICTPIPTTATTFPPPPLPPKERQRNCHWSVRVLNRRNASQWRKLVFYCLYPPDGLKLTFPFDRQQLVELLRPYELHIRYQVYLCEYLFRTSPTMCCTVSTESPWAAHALDLGCSLLAARPPPFFASPSSSLFASAFPSPPSLFASPPPPSPLFASSSFEDPVLFRSSFSPSHRSVSWGRRMPSSIHRKKQSKHHKQQMELLAQTTPLWRRPSLSRKDRAQSEVTTLRVDNAREFERLDRLGFCVTAATNTRKSTGTGENALDLFCPTHPVVLASGF